MSKKNAIMLAISDNYSFAAANVMMSIRDNSPKVFDECEFIIYHNCISETNKAVLLKIKNPIRFMQIEEYCFCDFINEYAKANKWGPFIFQKFNAFSMLKEYKKILWLDSDTFVNKAIDFIFGIESDIAGVSIGGKLPYDADSVDLAKTGIHCRAGVVLFNDKLNRFDISVNEIKSRCKHFEDDHRRLYGAPFDEKLIGYIISYYQMDFFELPREYHAFCREYINRNAITDFLNASVQHFANGPDTKPWTSDCLYRSLPKWAANHRKFIEMGGVNYPVLEDKLSFYNDAYSFNVMRSVAMTRSLLGKLDILQDSLFELDFYQCTDKLLFFFRHTNSILYVCIYWGGASGRYSVSLNMSKTKANKKITEDFKKLYEIFHKMFQYVKLIQQHDEIKIIIEYTDIGYTNQIINKLIATAKSKLFKKIYIITRKRKLIMIIIKMLVDEKRYKKLKRNPKMFFADSTSSFIRLLEKLYN